MATMACPTAPRMRVLRIWIDLTNSPHVLVMRPVIERLRAAGHDVEVTARDFAQTIGLLQRMGIEHEQIGRHRGERPAAKAVGLADRSLALVRWARGRRIDLALGHGSNDVSVAAALLRIPSATMFDYEWAKVQHTVNCRLASAVVVPDVIPPALLERYGARGKLRPYAGLKEEYYLADFEPDAGVLAELGLDAGRPLVVVRTPPEVSLYHSARDDVFARLLDRLRAAAADGVQSVVLTRIGRPVPAAQLRPRERGPGAPAAGGRRRSRWWRSRTPWCRPAGRMNRRGGRAGHPGLDDLHRPPGRGRRTELIARSGRLRRLTDAARAAEQTARAHGRRRGCAFRGGSRRDPQVLVDLLLSALPLR